MKLPFTWAELSPEDKALLEKVPAGAVWDFIDTLPELERLPFDDPYYSPSGADFMLEYGDRLRAFLRDNPNGTDITPEALAEWNRLTAGVDPEASKRATEEELRLGERYAAGELDFDAYMTECAKLRDAYMREHGAELEPLNRAMEERRRQVEEELRPYAPNGDLDTPESVTLAITRRLQANTLEAARNADREAQARGEKLAQATSSQGGTDRAHTKALAENAALKEKLARVEAEGAKLLEAYLALRDGREARP